MTVDEAVKIAEQFLKRSRGGHGAQYDAAYAAIASAHLDYARWLEDHSETKFSI